MKELFIVGLLVSSPFVIFFCMKFGTLGYYKAKQFIEKESKH